MRAYKRLGKEGFTLVELMIVVAIIGVLAALAIYGVRRYLASAKTSEAKNTIGAISRGAVASYERETAASQLVASGTNSNAATNSLCATATTVPVNVPAGTKYQPSTTANADFDSGSSTVGWKCLKFSMTQAIYYQYSYTTGASPVSQAGGSTTTVSAPDSFEAGATGDLDGDAATSKFARVGQAENGEMKVATQIFVADEFE